MPEEIGDIGEAASTEIARQMAESNAGARNNDTEVNAEAQAQVQVQDQARISDTANQLNELNQSNALTPEFENAVEQAPEAQREELVTAFAEAANTASEDPEVFNTFVETVNEIAAQEATEEKTTADLQEFFTGVMENQNQPELNEFMERYQI